VIYDLWFLLFLGWVTTLLIVFLFGYSSGVARMQRDAVLHGKAAYKPDELGASKWEWLP